MDWSIEFQKMASSVVQFLPRLISAVITFLVMLVVSSLADGWIRKLASRRTDNNETITVLARLGRWSILIIGTVVALEQVNFNVTGFVAGLGIAGFTLGFALQDIARNFISGILLLIRQPFKIGDAVEVSGFSGKVADIDIRDTTIQTWDGELVILPNTKVLENPIKNYSGLTKRRRSLRIGIAYTQDLNRARASFLAAMKNVPGVAQEPPPSLIAKELGDFALLADAYFWVDQTRNDLYGVHSAVVQAINEAAQRDQIDLPYPVQTVHIEKPREA